MTDKNLFYQQLEDIIAADDAVRLRTLIEETPKPQLEAAMHQLLPTADQYPLEMALHTSRRQVAAVLTQHTDLLRLMRLMASRGYSLEQLARMTDADLLRRLTALQSGNPAGGQWKRRLVVCDDQTCMACCCGPCCNPCTLGKITEKRATWRWPWYTWCGYECCSHTAVHCMLQSSTATSLLGCIISYFPRVLLRKELRETSNIPGDWVSDLAAIYLCMPCAVAQMKAEAAVV